MIVGGKKLLLLTCSLCFLVLAGTKIEEVFTPIRGFEEIDITKALTTTGRLYYPKIAKKTRIDDFLARRTHLKLLEERRLLQSVSRHVADRRFSH